MDCCCIVPGEVKALTSTSLVCGPRQDGSTLFDQTDDRYFFDAVHLRGGEPARRGTHRCHSCCQLSLTSKLFISLIGTRVCISVHVTTRSRFGGSALEIAPFSAPL